MYSHRLVLVALTVVSASLLIGCSTGGLFTAGNLTDVQLQKGNFKVVAHGVTGESSAGYVFGFSFSLGVTTNTFALARVGGTGLLYKEALEGLWKNFDAAHGTSDGRKVALVNVHYDADVLNLFLYTQAKVMVSADVVEFAD